MSNSFNDVQRAYALAMLGLTESTASTADLLYQIFAGLIGVGGGGGGGTITSINGDVGPTVTLTQSEVADDATKVAMLPTERTKLAGIATGATANSTDAQLRDRTTHTGVQTSSSISDFTEAAQDAVAAMLAAGGQISLSYNDAGNALTVSATGADAETMRDVVGAALAGVGNIAVTVNDGADTITISTTATVNDTDANLKNRANHTGSQTVSTLSDYTESTQDLIAAMISIGSQSGITITYDDTDGSLDFTVNQQLGTDLFSASVAAVESSGLKRAFQTRTFAEVHMSCRDLPVGSNLVVQVQTSPDGASWTTVTTMTITAGGSKFADTTGLSGTTQSAGHMTRINCTAAGSTTPAGGVAVEVVYV